jgi:hypothetical protein
VCFGVSVRAVVVDDVIEQGREDLLSIHKRRGACRVDSLQLLLIQFGAGVRAV